MHTHTHTHRLRFWLSGSTDHGSCVCVCFSLCSIKSQQEQIRPVPGWLWKPNPQQPPSANRISWKVSSTAPKETQHILHWLLWLILLSSLHNLLLVSKPSHIIFATVNNNFGTWWTVYNLRFREGKASFGWLVGVVHLCLCKGGGFWSTQVGEQYRARCLEKKKKRLGCA